MSGAPVRFFFFLLVQLILVEFHLSFSVLFSPLLLRLSISRRDARQV